MTDFTNIVVTILVFALGIFLGTRFRRRSRTFEFITQITITEPMVTESHKIYNLMNKFQNTKPTLQDLKPEELQTVMIVASFYEFLGLSMLQRLLNRKVILLSRYAAMAQVWDTFESVIVERRRELNRPYLFGSFQKAVSDFRDHYKILQAVNYSEQVGEHVKGMWWRKLIGRIF